MHRLLAVTTMLATAAAAEPPPVLSGVGFVGPECVRYDAVQDRYFVSNLNGEAPGFISVVTPDGAVDKLKWIDGAGLTDPLGMAITRMRLFVVDPDRIHIFDRASGAALQVIAVPGAQRLNDINVAPDGTIYVTDSARPDQPGALYRVSAAGKVSTWVARDDALEKPNGIAVMPDGTVVHGGRGVNLVFRNPAGRILRERSLPTGRVDGIVALADGALLVASQDGHTVYHVGANNGSITQVAKDIEVPAAIGYDSKRKRLIVPQIRAATVTFVDLKQP